jgi:hypothetical protein
MRKEESAAKMQLEGVKVGASIKEKQTQQAMQAAQTTPPEI